MAVLQQAVVQHLVLPQLVLEQLVEQQHGRTPKFAWTFSFRL